jgi:hypothetical protein|nr:MAG TPA: hypothetical protein [Caudoviricetes sp.]
MIIENGTIELKQKTTSGGGIDPNTGYPIKPSSVGWSAPIPCQYFANKYNNIGRVSGEHFKVAQYTVLIEAQPLGGAEQLRLKDRAGHTVGEFSIIQAEPLDAVCEIRILI